MWFEWDLNKIQIVFGKWKNYGRKPVENIFVIKC
nr:MAG TPA: hypothetical protein [Caudoviricetes sp.]